jgi:hypothetical protein
MQKRNIRGEQLNGLGFGFRVDGVKHSGTFVAILDVLPTEPNPSVHVYKIRIFRKLRCEGGCVTLVPGTH